VERVPLGRRFPKDRREALTRAEFDGCSILEALASGDPADAAYLVHGEGPLRRGLAMEAARFGSPFFTVYDGATDSKEALAAVRELAHISRDGNAVDAAVSATSLEDYARCPFAFFVRHVLGIRLIEEPEDAAAPTPLERGELYHAVLDSFLKRSRKAGRIPLSRSDLDALIRTVGDIAASGRWAFASRAGSRELELLDLRRNLALWLRSEVTEASPFRPAYFEARFGGRARPDDDTDLSLGGPVPFEAAGGARVAFRGKIDRIDLDPERGAARVIDYKTGTPQAKASAVFDRGRALQLPVYLLAAQAMLDAAGRGSTVESAEYLYVTTPKRESRSLSREDLEGAREEFRKAVGLIVKGIAEGMFFPWPEDNRCDSCELAAACGTNSVVLALARMKQGDRRAKFFTEGLAVIE
jgi:RecB family exonuclease